MALAWSSAEVIRYSFYTFTLSGFNVYALLWLRYTMFYVLYPLGVASESSLIFLSLPHSPELGWLRGSWNFIDYFRASQFLIWWPGTPIVQNVVQTSNVLLFASFICAVYLHDRAAS